jgi:formylglycine-generating enzyme required for sulfatase activity
MVNVPPGYCIDATEVTRGAYVSWLATNPSTTGQPAACSWNADYNPDSTCASNAEVCQGSGCGNHPQVCVDWCDAYAFCAAGGKRLCGKISGGDNAYGDYGNASKSQWFNACTKGASTAYPYGNAFQPDACNGMDKAIDSTVPVGSLPGCEGGFPGVFDMSGNAWEWEDSCNGTSGNTDLCRLRGGSFGNWSGFLHCDLPYQGNTRNYYSQYIGLRCCS